LEDLSNIIVTADTPNLLNAEDWEEITQNVRNIIKDIHLVETKEMVEKMYNKKVGDNLHILVNLSPIGDKLRNRYRQVLNFM
jgi:dynein heavy chain